jgi:DNA-binding NarL/FixJ family response regulator
MGTVVVAARLQLIGQALGAAMTGLGVRAEPVRWGRAVRLVGPALETGDVMVLLDDLASIQDLEATCDLIASTRARCIVLTRRPAGPAWGALLAAGAAAVLTADGSPERIGVVVHHVAAGEPIMDPDVRTELVRVWETWRDEDARLSDRFTRLSARERQILALLSEGSSVGDIVRILGVAETTVRSQVKSMRRKLGVDSQLGAVAVLHRLGLVRTDQWPNAVGPLPLAGRSPAVEVPSAGSTSAPAATQDTERRP